MSVSQPADLVPISAQTAALWAAFAAAGHQLHLVGGSVRDALMGRAANPGGTGGGAEADLDLTTDARPEQTLAILGTLTETIWTTGIEFGTIGARLGGQTYEITTFRADRYDRVSRNPQVAFGDNLRDDLYRRDFTMNAMAVSVTEPEAAQRTFTDPFGGLADLARGIARTPAPAQESFADDPLRMLRAARFASTLGITVAPEVAQAMSAMAAELGRITPERVQAEFSKLLGGAHPRAGLGLLVDTGLAQVFLPELPGLRMTTDEHGRHKDVYAHTLQVLEQAIALEAAEAGSEQPDLVLRMAALLHDIGKPATRESTDGRVSFHHHEVVGARMVRHRLKELRYSKAFIDDVAQLVFLHLRFYGYREGAWTDSAVRRYVVDAGPLLPRLHKLVRSDVTTRNVRKAQALARAYDTLEERIAELAAAEELAAIRPDLDGNAIMQILGIPSGRLVGQAYQHMLALRMEHVPMAHEDAVAALRAWWAEQSSA